MAEWDHTQLALDMAAAVWSCNHAHPLPARRQYGGAARRHVKIPPTPPPGKRLSAATPMAGTEPFKEHIYNGRMCQDTADSCCPRFLDDCMRE